MIFIDDRFLKIVLIPHRKCIQKDRIDGGEIGGEKGGGGEGRGR